LYLIILLADFCLPIADLGPVETPPCILHLILPFLQILPGALQGLLPCLVNVSHCNLKSFHLTILFENQFNYLLLEKRKKRKRK
tara:strand:- start:437 stop:688 length:252 start_codon:yes stop_codon:yes gene_type:complete